MNRILKKTEYKLSDINQAVHVSIYCMSVQKNRQYTLNVKKKKEKMNQKTTTKPHKCFLAMVSAQLKGHQNLNYKILLLFQRKYGNNKIMAQIVKLD